MQKALGIHHVGFGVKDLKKTRKYYEETLEFRGMLEEWEYSINSMADTFRNSAHNFEGWMPFQEAGGIIIEPILMKYPTPRPIHRNPQYGDIGVNKLTIAVSDVGKFCKAYRDKVNFCGKPKKAKLKKAKVARVTLTGPSRIFRSLTLCTIQTVSAVVKAEPK